MVTGRLFHKVAAAFLKHLLPHVTPRVVERQVPLSTEEQSLEVP